MNFAIFRCCPTSVLLKQYETSTDAVLARLGVGLVDIKEFNCCGQPLKNYDYKAYLLASVRNLCIAERHNLNILTVCNCCYGNLKNADHLMKQDASIREEISGILNREGLRYNGGIKIRHFLDFLYSDIGVEQIRQKAVKKLDKPNIAVHYGCHILRPREIAEFDNPEKPSKFDQLVEALGAQSTDWDAKVKCCGAPVFGVNDNLAMDITAMKVSEARKSGAQFLCVSCVYCQLQFDSVQKMIVEKRNNGVPLPSILYTQLLGLCLGVDTETLGIKENQLDAGGILDFMK
ncbi:conserved hypothetical protein [uncultured Desulfobacterium sp.]|uniref:Cysteine-rich domain-containing protein n=1 Tax=uncultured Desulfobacterium sp. TaxID=201089 RepID=A0A445MTJ5_9BACT|nr:conserved hypothetical protein [uncultured Desulfobacterium sp.]